MSRTHATLSLKKGCLILTDEGSKYGVYLNDNIENKVRLISKSQTVLKKGDRVNFGLKQSEFVVEEIKIQTATSTMTLEERKELQEKLNRIGGKVVDNVTTECTHLTMNKIVVTTKQLLSMVIGFPIVSLNYWDDILKAITEHKPLPDAKQYLPEVGEVCFSKDGHLFAVNTARKQVFKGKTFYFFSSKQYEIYKEVIDFGGGKPIALDKVSDTKKSQLVAQNAVVMRYDAEPHSQAHSKIEALSSYIRSKSLRLIPEVEIQLAILHISTQKYCNPKYTFDENFAELKATKSDILAPCTEDTGTNVQASTSKRIHIPETVPNSVNDDSGPSLEVINYKDEPIIIPDSDSEESEVHERPIEKLAVKPEPIIEEVEQNPKKTQGKRRRGTTEPDESIFNAKKVALEQKDIPTDQQPIPSVSEDFMEEESILNTDLGSDVSEWNLTGRKIQEPPKPTTSSALPGTSRRGTRRRREQEDSEALVFQSEPNELIGGQQQTAEKEASKSSSAPTPQSIRTRSNRRDEPASRRRKRDDNTDTFSLFKSNVASPSIPDRRSKRLRGQNEDQEILQFNTQRPSTPRKRIRQEQETVQTIIQKPPNERPNSILNNIKIIPIAKETSEGWLSATLNKQMENISIKAEPDDEASSAYIKHFEDAFEVTMKKINLVSHTTGQSHFDVTDGSSTNTTSGTSSTTNGSKKNFKAFVKKFNYKPQTIVIRPNLSGFEQDELIRF